MKTSNTELAALWEWYRATRLIGCKPGTIKHYELEFSRLGKHVGHEPTTADLTDEVITAMFAAMQADGRAPATVNKSRAVWKAFGDFLARKRLIEFLELPRQAAPRREPKAWRIEDISRLVAQCNSRKYMANGIQEGPFFRALILTAYCTGERIGALRSSLFTEYESPFLLIRAEDRKGGSADKLHKLSAECALAIESIRHPERDFIFDIPFSEQTLTSRFDKLCEAAGLSPEARNKWHKLRRTCATGVAARAGVDAASDALGHASTKITKDHYIDKRLVNRKFAADILPEVGWRPEG